MSLNNDSVWAACPLGSPVYPQILAKTYTHAHTHTHTLLRCIIVISRIIIINRSVLFPNPSSIYLSIYLSVYLSVCLSLFCSILSVLLPSFHCLCHLSFLSSASSIFCRLLLFSSFSSCKRCNLLINWEEKTCQTDINGFRCDTRGFEHSHCVAIKLHKKMTYEHDILYPKRGLSFENMWAKMSDSTRRFSPSYSFQTRWPLVL